jgi:hypothetical protein
LTDSPLCRCWFLAGRNHAEDVRIYRPGAMFARRLRRDSIDLD